MASVVFCFVTSIKCVITCLLFFECNITVCVILILVFIFYTTCILGEDWLQGEEGGDCPMRYRGNTGTRERERETKNERKREK